MAHHRFASCPAISRRASRVTTVILVAFAASPALAQGPSFGGPTFGGPAFGGPEIGNSVSEDSSFRNPGPALQPAPIDRPNITPANRVSNGPSHFGVMGAVAEPGVYASESQFPLLVDIVREAGGLTRDATGNVRIVRNGRSGQQTFYTPNLDFRLLPGDLLVVDRYPPHRSRVQVTGDASIDRETTVQLAFLDLVDRPVVLQMRPRTATIAQILHFLGQSRDIVASIRVLETGPRYTRGDRTVDTELASGSVLMFDRSSILVDRLPELPAVKGAATGPRPLPDNPAAVSVAGPGDDPLPHREVSAAPLSVPTGVPASNASLTNPRRAFEPTPLPLDNDPTEDLHPGGGLSNVDAETMPLPMPSFGGPTAGREDEGDAFLDASPAGIPEDAALPLDSESTDDETAAALPVDPEGLGEGTKGTTSARADGGSLYIVLGVLCLAAGLIWFLSRRPSPLPSAAMAAPSEESLPAEPTYAEAFATSPVVESESEPVAAPVLHAVPELPATPEPRTQFRLDTEHATRPGHTESLVRTNLDELIEGRITLEEEPVELPESMELFGRSNSERRYRIDHAEEAAEAEARGAGRHVGPRRPHFLRKSRETVDAEVSETAASKTESPDETVEGEHRTRMLDRALTAVHGANRR